MAYAGEARFRFNGTAAECSRYIPIARTLVERTMAMYDIGGGGADAATQTKRLGDGAVIKVTVFSQVPPIITITAGKLGKESAKIRDLCPYGMSWQVENTAGDSEGTITRIRGGKRTELTPLSRGAEWSRITAPKWVGPHVKDFWEYDTWTLGQLEDRQTPTRFRRNQACKAQAVGSWLGEAENGSPVVYIKGGQWNGTLCAPARRVEENVLEPPLPKDFWLIKYEGVTYAVVHQFPLVGAEYTSTVDFTLELYPVWPGFVPPTEQQIQDGDRTQSIHTLSISLDVSDTQFDTDFAGLLDVSGDGTKFLVQVKNSSASSLGGTCFGNMGRIGFGSSVNKIVEVTLSIGLVGVDQNLELSYTQYELRDYRIELDAASANFETEKAAFIAAGGAQELFNHSLGSGPEVSIPDTPPSIAEAWNGTRDNNATLQDGFYEATADFSTVSGGSSTVVEGEYVSYLISAFYDDEDELRLTTIDTAQISREEHTRTMSGTGSVQLGLVYGDAEWPYGATAGTAEVTVSASSETRIEMFSMALIRHGTETAVLRCDTPEAITTRSATAVHAFDTSGGVFYMIAFPPNSSPIGAQKIQNYTFTTNDATHNITATVANLVPAGYSTAAAMLARTLTSGLTIRIGVFLGIVDTAGNPKFRAEAVFSSASVDYVNTYMSPGGRGHEGLVGLSKYALTYEGEIASRLGTQGEQFNGEFAASCLTIGGDPKIATVETYRRVGDTDESILSVGPFFTHLGIIDRVIEIGQDVDETLPLPTNTGVDRTPTAGRRQPATIPTCASAHPKAPIVAVAFEGPVSFAGMWPYNWPMLEDKVTENPPEYLGGLGLGESVYPLVNGAPAINPIVLVVGTDPPYSNEGA